MLWCDTFRGDHSTGVAAWYKSWNTEGSVKVAKMAVDGAEFVKTDVWKNVRSSKSLSAANVEVVTWPKAIFGHNRYATMGAINAVNAHPFQHGHITLAHNGTLRKRNNLPEFQRFEVDSENICYSISQIGAAETIKRLVGAFALIWIDSQEQTLNIIRNTEREFHLFETTFGDWFGCSEEKMGDWILTRGRFPRNIKNHFECKPGTQYVFDLSKGSCDFKEEIERELAPFQDPWASRGYSYGGRWEDYEDGYDDWWNDRIKHNRTVAQTATPTKEEKPTPPANETYRETVRKLLGKYGLDCQIGDKVEMQMYEFYEYPRRPGFGRIVGWVPSASDFMEVQVHDIRADEFQMDGTGLVEICSAYEVNYVPTIIGKPDNNRFFGKDEEDQGFTFIAEEFLPERRTTISGEAYSEDEWSKSEHNVCAMCSDIIDFEDLEFATIENGYCFCGSCINQTEEEAKTIEKSNVIALPSPPPTFREGYGREPSEEPPFKVIPVGNGMRVNQALWSQMNGCRECGKAIPWGLAEHVEFWGHAPVCPDCSDTLDSAGNR